MSIWISFSCYKQPLREENSYPLLNTLSEYNFFKNKNNCNKEIKLTAFKRLQLKICLKKN